MGEELRKGIEHIGMVCPICLSPVIIVKKETLKLFLDKDGYPINHNEALYEIYGKCLNCDFDFPVKKQGLKYYPYSLVREVVEQSSRKYKEKENPFGWWSKNV